MGGFWHPSWLKLAKNGFKIDVENVILGDLGASWGARGASWLDLGAILVLSELLGASWSVLAPSWVDLGASWLDFGGQEGAQREACWELFGKKMHTRSLPKTSGKKKWILIQILLDLGGAISRKNELSH